MKAEVKWWHWVIALSLLAVLCVVLWRGQSSASSPTISEAIPPGENANRALELNMDGGH